MSESARIRLAVAVVPLMLALWTTKWLDTPLRYIDTWIYYGYFLNLPDYKRPLFDATYYGERLGWLLPGYVVHHLFEPAAARAALLGTILIVTTPSVIAALGTDYIDGPASVYNLIALPASWRRPRTVPELDRGALGRVSLPVLGRDAVRVAST